MLVLFVASSRRQPSFSVCRYSWCGPSVDASIAFAGILADRTRTRRSPFLLGLIFLLGATILLCLGRTLPALVIGRLFQGIAAGIVSTVGFALLVDTIGQESLGQAVGWVSYAFTLGLLLGPLLGGVVYDKGGYYATFSMAFGLIGCDIVLRLLVIEKKVAERWAAEEAEEKGRKGTKPEAMEAQAEEKNVRTRPGEDDAISSPAIAPSNQADRPMLPSPADVVTQCSPTPSSSQRPQVKHSKRPWRDRLPPILSLLTFPRPLVTVSLTAAASLLYTAFDVVLPLRAATLFHFSSLGAGLLFLPILIPAFTAPLVGWASDRYGPKWIVVVGFVLAAPALILLRLVNRNTLGMKVLLCGLLAWLGLALDLILTPMIAEFAACVEEDADRRGLHNIPLKDRDLEQQLPSDSSTSPAGISNGSVPKPSAPNASPNQHQLSPLNAYAQAYGLFTSAYAVGMLLGPLWAGNVAQRAGWATMALSLGVFTAVCAVPAAVWTGGEVQWLLRWREGRSRKDGAR